MYPKQVSSASGSTTIRARTQFGLIGLPSMSFAINQGVQYFGVFLVTAGSNANILLAWLTKRTTFVVSGRELLQRDPGRLQRYCWYRWYCWYCWYCWLFRKSCSTPLAPDRANENRSSDLRMRQDIGQVLMPPLFATHSSSRL